MPDMTIQEFCELHGACREGSEWALASCQSMRDVWDIANPERLLWVATRRGVLTERDLRLFAVRCARSVEHLLTDQRSRRAIEVAERFAVGNATDRELAAASDAAFDEARTAALAAASAATAASAAASAAARTAASAAASAATAASAAASAAASDEARGRAAARAAARGQHAAWLRELTPCFDRKGWEEVVGDAAAK